MDIKKQMIERLKKDCDILLNVKIPKALENVNDEKGQGINTYRNLTKALAENIKLIEEYDWKLMYSEYDSYTCDSNGNRLHQVSVWEQNSNGEVRNHKVFDVNDKFNKQNNKYEDFKENILSLVENFSQDGKIIIPTSDAIRGVGKTTFLIEQALKNNGIYVCGSRKKEDLAKEMAYDMLGCPPKTIVVTCLKDINFKSTLYIDEDVNLDNINLENSKYIAFKYVPLNK